MARIILLTGNCRRHTYVANILSVKHNLVGILTEAKSPVVSNKQKLSSNDRKIVDAHFKQRDEAEGIWFGTPSMDRSIPCLEVENGAINGKKTLDWIKKANPKIIVLYGTSIIRNPIMEEFDGKIINMHLGLSPYYRGSGTNYWPLVERKPEAIGTTIHLANDQVDAGPILAQIRPKPNIKDQGHDLGMKAIIRGAELLSKVITLFESGEIKGSSQQLDKGIVYKRKDFCADSVKKMWRQFDTGMMAEYIENIDNRQSKYPIITLSKVV